MNKSIIYPNPKGKDEYYTPKSIIDYVNGISLKTITLDPATTKEQAKRLGIYYFYTKETNGLDKDWSNEVVWLNPPFSNKEEWVKKARWEVNNNNCVVFLLLPMSLETKIFHEYILDRCIIHIPNKRIKFLGGKSAPFGSAIYELTKEWCNEYKTFEVERWN